MSEEQVKGFLELVKANSELQEKLKEAGDADAVIAIAKDEGFLISTKEQRMLQVEISRSDCLSDEELESVSGGYPTHLNRVP